MRGGREKGLLFLKGMAMGAADSVPGVSGGTIAFITNIYEELIFSLQSINLRALQVLYARGPLACWRHINGTFLLTLLLGIVSSLLLLANTVLFLLDQYPQMLYAFFTGLVLASCWYVAGKVDGWRWPVTLSGAAGCAVSLGVAMLPESAADPTLVYIFFSGALAICAMILPGISGAFILILLGAYENVLGALRNFEVTTIVVFAAGCAGGLIAFSNLLGYLFRHYRTPTLGFLFGILLGSLYSIWPWKLPVSFRTDQESGVRVPVLYENVMPGEYARVTGEEASLAAALALALIGFILVWGLEKLAAGRR